MIPLIAILVPAVGIRVPVAGGTLAMLVTYGMRQIVGTRI